MGGCCIVFIGFVVFESVEQRTNRTWCASIQHADMSTSVSLAFSEAVPSTWSFSFFDVSCLMSSLGGSCVGVILGWFLPWIPPRILDSDEARWWEGG